ncbi:MAG: PspC domain-containing protein [Streptosporangiaceae bacterium]
MNNASVALYRPRRRRVIAGVCAGIADRLGWSPWLVRVLFVVSCVLPGPQVVVYLLLWFLMPNERPKWRPPATRKAWG